MHMASVMKPAWVIGALAALAALAGGMAGSAMAQSASPGDARFALRASLQSAGDETANARYRLIGKLHHDGIAPKQEAPGGYRLQANLFPFGNACLTDLIFANGFQ